MVETLKAIVTAIAAFTAINLDNVFILVTLFSHHDSSLRKRDIVIGQYIGFVILMILSLFGTVGTDQFSHKWIAALGIVPIYMGVKALILNRRKKDETADDKNREQKLDDHRSFSNAFFRFLLNINILKVAAIAVANGDDDIGVYISLFSNSNLYQIIVSIIVFVILVGVMCYISYKLIKHPLVSKLLLRYGHIVNPFMLIGLGIYIIVVSVT